MYTCTSILVYSLMYTCTSILVYSLMFNTAAIVTQDDLDLTVDNYFSYLEVYERYEIHTHQCYKPLCTHGHARTHVHNCWHPKALVSKEPNQNNKEDTNLSSHF